MNLRSLLIAFATLTIVSPVFAEPATNTVGKAKELFRAYTELEVNFDPAIADLYADEAYIENTRTYPTGQERKMVLPATKYKELIRQTMPLAKSRGDTGHYSDITYEKEGKGVRITASRYSDLKKYESPILFLVAPSPDGAWLIYEEISRSIP